MSDIAVFAWKAWNWLLLSTSLYGWYAMSKQQASGILETLHRTELRPIDEDPIRDGTTLGCQSGNGSVGREFGRQIHI